MCSHTYSSGCALMSLTQKQTQVYDTKMAMWTMSKSCFIEYFIVTAVMFDITLIIKVCHPNLLFYECQLKQQGMRTIWHAKIMIGPKLSCAQKNTIMTRS